MSARCVQRDRPGFLIYLKLLGRQAIGEILSAPPVHLDAFCFSPISFELRITIPLNLSESDREFLYNIFLKHLFRELWAVK